MSDEKPEGLDSGVWERVDGTFAPRLYRLKVPGGWLVTVCGGFSYPITFYPDPVHQWNPPTKKKTIFDGGILGAILGRSRS